MAQGGSRGTWVCTVDARGWGGWVWHLESGLGAPGRGGVGRGRGCSGPRRGERPGLRVEGCTNLGLCSRPSDLGKVRAREGTGPWAGGLRPESYRRVGPRGVREPESVGSVPICSPGPAAVRTRGTGEGLRGASGGVAGWSPCGSRGIESEGWTSRRGSGRHAGGAGGEPRKTQGSEGAARRSLREGPGT